MRSAAAEALTRCRAIVAELLAGVRHERAACEHIIDHFDHQTSLTASERTREVERLAEIGRSTVGVYVFLFRELTEASLAQDRTKVEGVLRVLQVERETAQLVCEQLPAAPQLTVPHSGNQEITAAQAAATNPIAIDLPASDAPSFSADA